LSASRPRAHFAASNQQRGKSMRTALMPSSMRLGVRRTRVGILTHVMAVTKCRIWVRHVNLLRTRDAAPGHASSATEMVRAA
jgi:hypothetical protein